MGYFFLKFKNISDHSFSDFRHKWIFLPSSKYFEAGIVAITKKINLFERLNNSSINSITSTSGICSITSVQITPSYFLFGYIEYSSTPGSYKCIFWICQNSDKLLYSTSPIWNLFLYKNALPQPKSIIELQLLFFIISLILIIHLDKEN